MAPLRRLGIVLFAVTAALGMHAASAATGPAASKPVMADEMTLGNPKAKVTVIEYGSAACPHCAKFNNEVFADFRKKYIDTGKVHYVFREFLTDPVPFAATAFMMARCTGNDQKYFEVLNDVFHQQEAIYASGDLPGGLLKIGAKYGMSKDQLNGCMSDKVVEALQARVVKNSKDIEAVPTFLIGAQKLQGEKTLDQMSEAVDAELAK